MKRTISIVLCAALALCLLAACGGKKVTDDVAVSGIAERVDEVAGSADFAVMDENYIKSAMRIDVSDYADYIVKVNSKGANIDEYGVFHGRDAEQTKQIEQAVKDYFAFYREKWMPEYMPEEFPKLEAERITVVGNYVMYVILSDEAGDAAFKAFSDCLTEG